MTEAAADPYRCPTPCDPDCEISDWGCHESHDVPSHREHAPEACEAKTAMANLSWLFGSGWLTQLGSSGVPDGHPPVFYAALRKPMDSRVSVTVYGASVAEAAGKAAQWAREGAGT